MILKNYLVTADTILVIFEELSSPRNVEMSCFWFIFRILHVGVVLRFYYFIFFFLFTREIQYLAMEGLFRVIVVPRVWTWWMPQWAIGRTDKCGLLLPISCHRKTWIKKFIAQATIKKAFPLSVRLVPTQRTFDFSTQPV